jgi:tripartite-type tricarboxylate transporter receptor subunit TctC
MKSKFVAAVLAAVSLSAWAYPEKPIRIIVPYAAGGGADITGRVTGQKLSEILGVPVLIENKGGANGTIGTDFVAKAEPDGYTLLMDASGPLVINPWLNPRMPYDSVKDLAPISQVTSYQYVMVVPSSSPIKSIKDIVARAKAQPGAVSYGSSGIGGGAHLAGELLAMMSGTRMTHVPYKGNAPALADLLGGQLTFTYDTVITSVPYLKTGRLRAFAVSGIKRTSTLPDVPTMSEAGFKGFEVTQFHGLLAPANTPSSIVLQLHRAVVTALKSPTLVQQLGTDGGNDLVGSTPAEFAAQIKYDLALYKKLVATARIKLE